MGGWFAAYLACAFLRLMPLSLHPAARLADEGDGLLSAWIVSWTAGHLTSPQRLLDANVFYPHPHGSLYQEPQIMQSLLAWPLRAVLGEPSTTLNLLTMASLAAAALAFHLFAYELTRDDAASCAGSVLFAFNSFTLSNLPRLQIASVQWFPAALLALHLYAREPSRGRAWMLGLASLALAVSSLYYLLFYLVVLAILVPIHAARVAGDRRPRMLAGLALIGALDGVVVAALAVPYVALFHRYGYVGTPAPFDLSLYLLPLRGNALYGAWAAPLRPPGFYLDYFVGFAALALAVVGVAHCLTRRVAGRALTLAYLACGVAALLFSAGTRIAWRGLTLGAGPYLLLRHLEPYRNLREPRRFAVVVVLVVALFAAQGVAVMLRRWPRRRVVLAVALGAGLALEHWNPDLVQGSEIPAGRDVPPVYDWIAANPAVDVVAELPARPPRLSRLAALEQYFSVRHGKAILFGHPSFRPPALDLILWELRDFPDARSLVLLRGLGVRWIAVHPKRWGERRAFYERRLAARSDQLRPAAAFGEDGAPVWAHFQLGGERIYELGPAAAEGRAADCACREIPRQRLRAYGDVGRPALALDGRRDTAWTTSRGQLRGDRFEIALDRPRPVRRVEIEMAYPYGEFARHLEVAAFVTGEYRPAPVRADPWYVVDLVRQLVSDPRLARLRYDIPGDLAERIRLTIGGAEEDDEPWTIPELHLYESAPTEAASP